MSNTIYNLQFSICVADRDHWTEQQERQFEDQEDVMLRLDEVMRKAANAFVTKHPELFRGEVI